MSEPVLAIIRALGFGGFLGAGIFGLAHLLFLHRLAPALPFENFTLVGAFLGAGLAHVAAKFSAAIFSPLVIFIDHYRKRLELAQQLRSGLVRPETASYINDELAKRYFLGADPGRPESRVGFK